MGFFEDVSEEIRKWEPTAGQIVYWVGPFFERVRQSNREGIQLKAGGKELQNGPSSCVLAWGYGGAVPRFP